VSIFFRTPFPTPMVPHCNGHVAEVLVTGGAGYIGSHTVLELVNAGYKVVVVDNLVNSSEEAVHRVRALSGKPDMIALHIVDLRDAVALDAVFAQHRGLSAVIHFAALKAVGESIKKPLDYYENNLGGTFTLLKCMDKHNCRQLVFSSSATVYGDAPIPYVESGPVGSGITNPYGSTKYMIESILRDIHASPTGNQWAFVMLRYFNPVGAHPSGRIGEHPDGIPNNIMPYLSQVAVGSRDSLTIFGGPGNEPYDTADGTCERDFIHVVDLARGHVKALDHMQEAGLGHYDAYNLGSGKPASVLQLLRALEGACGRPIAHKIGPRRSGDLPAFWANVDKAERELGWRTEKTLEDICRDQWAWQSRNPHGYSK